MTRMDNIISNFSAYIIMGFRVKHDGAWHEHRVKTNYTLWAVKEGNIFIEINGRRFTAQKGDAVLFYPQNEYSANTDENGCDFVVVHFRLEAGADMDLFAGLNLAGIAGNISGETLVFCDKFMRGHLFARRTSFDQYVEFISYIRNVINIQKNDDAVRFYTRTHSADKTIIQIAVDYISHNYRTITVKDAADYVHMNEKRFITNFKKAVNLSPGQYIHRCKMQKAAELLSGGDMKIADIARYLGFSDPYSFSKAFKRTFGEAPKAFRHTIV